MANRREFTRPVQGQIILRATKEGRVYCENCGVLCKPGQFQIDHTDPDAMQIDKTRKLTAEDGKLLCTALCHPEKTKKDVADIARAKRRQANHLGAKKPSAGIQSAGFPAVDRSTKRAAMRPVQKKEPAPKPIEKFASLGPGNLTRRFTTV